MFLKLFSAIKEEIILKLLDIKLTCMYGKNFKFVQTMTSRGQDGLHHVYAYAQWSIKLSCKALKILRGEYWRGCPHLQDVRDFPKIKYADN